MVSIHQIKQSFYLVNFTFVPVDKGNIGYCILGTDCII